MKSYELLNNKTSVVIARATIDGSPVKMRIVRGKRKNDLNTWQVEVRVFVKGPKWAACHWFDCQDKVDNVFKATTHKFPHVNFVTIV